MTQEQLMKVKIKYLEDRITTMEKSIERLHKMLPRLAREFMQQDQGFKDIEHLSKDNGNELI
jgi:prefoldin subunit 5